MAANTCSRTALLPGAVSLMFRLPSWSPEMMRASLALVWVLPVTSTFWILLMMNPRNIKSWGFELASALIACDETHNVAHADPCQEVFFIELTGGTFLEPSCMPLTQCAAG